ncbi:hypothetical protein [Neobacillus sp. D3-1R]|uniref:hypothetical protein n=1 Tax=Neobacillus sp. D3-1R TaxID=3445778 RepID=UPI003FA0DDEE
MSDWNEQAAANNNLNSATIKSSKLVGKEGVTASVDTSEVSTEMPTEGKDAEYLQKHLLSRQPGM